MRLGDRAYPLLSLPAYFPTGSLQWLVLNVGFDIFLGLGIYFLLDILRPRFESYIEPYWNPGAAKGKGAWVTKGANLTTWRGIFHQAMYILWFGIKVFVFVIGIIGVTLTLVLSVGWHNPLSWQGLYYDLIYARTNLSPNSAHLPSELGVAAFALLVCFKLRRKPARMFEDVMGDPYQAIAAAGFLGAVHEGFWMPAYYVAYSGYLSWTILPEVLRDVSFGVLVIVLIITFWKYKGRSLPLRIFKWPIALYLCFLAAWFFLPVLFGYPFLPITTINNPNLGAGLYQQTPFYSLAWVNLVEVASWVLLWSSFMVVVARYKK